ncbi:hypothetical protein [Azospirillum argentinense]|uniref:hypothetical protein n=1 Tax=Azospirillum argentinense TaxID=2970906 RepID=UPI0010C08D9A|nr:hypothetical protein [Azospirillum argentinense]
MGTFSDFLTRNSVAAAGNMPLVHSTRAHFIKHIMREERVIASPCDVFTKDRLNYFFVGRPSYKFDGDSAEAEYWELPCCFIFDFNSINGIKRIFPFDSGAFYNKRYPQYINRMKMDDFNVSRVSRASERIIGAFFGSIDSYYHLKPKDKISFETEFSLGAFDEELRALHKLAMHSASTNFDDRRFAIEVQSEEDVDLNLNKPLAVVVPSVYYDDLTFRNHVEGKWGAQAISYPVFSLSVSQYYYAIYERVASFYKKIGVL